MNIFHISEIVDLGIEKEKKRRDFYAQAASVFAEPALKELFTQLKDWEEMHIKKFTDIRNSLDRDEAAESYPDELRLYMQSLVDERLYQKVSVNEFSKNVKTTVDAIEVGISFEKDAVLFFSELLNYTADAHKQVIRQLIEEEKKHIVYLAELRKKVN